MSLRAFGRTRAAARFAGALPLIPPWLLTRPLSAAARGWERRFYRGLAAGFLAGVRRTGAPPGGPGTLYICNHVSWLDIPALASVLDADFVAKDDVAGWPLVGALARRTGTLFVARERRARAGAQADAIAERLRAGGSLLLFPEGTTSTGLEILPFRSALFAAAEAARRVQPMALCYHRADGGPLDDTILRRIAWFDEETLAAHAATTARFALSAEVRLLEGFTVGPEDSRKALATRTRDAIVAAYAAMRRGAPNRSE